MIRIEPNNHKVLNLKENKTNEPKQAFAQLLTKEEASFLNEPMKTSSPKQNMLGQIMGGKPQEQVENLEKSIHKDQQRKQIFRDFESMFIHMMLKSMRKASPEGGVLGQSNGMKVYKDMLDKMYADTMADNDSMGISNMLAEFLKDSDVSKQNAPLRIK